MERARSHFKENGLRVGLDKQAFTTLVRLHAKDYLRRQSIDAFELTPFTNLCGIWLRIDTFLVKVLRISEEEKQDAEREAGSSNEQFWLTERDNEPIPLLPLRVYWSLDKKGFVQTFLAYPKYVESKYLDCYWFKAVPEPTARMPQAFSDIAQDLEDVTAVEKDDAGSSAARSS